MKSNEEILKERCNNFIKKSNIKHNNKYDYSKVNYVNNHTKVCIICPEHGEFWQQPNNHFSGNGCPKCAKVLTNLKRTLGVECFIKKSKEIHGDKYDYSKVKYINSKTNVCIICPIHGEFWIAPTHHLKEKRGCPQCNERIFNTETFIIKANKIHNSKYDYSKTIYNGYENKVIIICPIHGEFKQSPDSHLHSYGCPQCGYEKRREKRLLNQSDFIERANKIHNHKFNYGKVIYKGCEKHITIICPIHGEFKQSPYVHLHSSGCPFCKESFLERNINNILLKVNINFERQKKFKWLGRQSLDFYLSKYNIAIECQGEQHFKCVEIFGGNNQFVKQQHLDLKKKKLCQENNIKLIYFIRKEHLSLINENKEDIYFSDEEELINYIKKHIK